MISRQYQFKFFLNARHALKIDGKMSSHPHTWEIGLALVKENQEFVQFSHLEEVIIDHLKIYESKTLNEIHPFDHLPPTLEIIGEVLYEQLNELLEEAHWRISSLEISETSARSYSIKDVAYRFRGFNPLQAAREGHDSFQLHISKDGAIKRPGIKKATQIVKSTLETGHVEPKTVTIIDPGQAKEIEALKEQLSTLQALIESSNKVNDVENKSLSEAQPESNVMDEVSSSINTLEFTKDSGLSQEWIEKETKKAIKKAVKKALKKSSKKQGKEADETSDIHEAPIEEVQVLDAAIDSNEYSTTTSLEDVDESDEDDSDEDDFDDDDDMDEDKTAIDDNKATEEIDNQSEEVCDDQKIETLDAGDHHIEPSTPKIKKLLKHFVTHPIYLVVTMLIVSFILIFAWITREGLNPWGSDTWGHIFKTHFLYKEFIKGNIFPQYTDLWYNGIQPFRYWAPVPYYVMLIGELVSGGNSLVGYYVFIAIVFFGTAIPFVIYGKKKGHIYLGTFLGILYFVLPDNYRLLLAEGNLPRVVVSIFFPYLVLGIFSYYEKRHNLKLVFIFCMMALITLTHAMIAALTGITVFLFVLTRLIVYRDKVFESLYILASAVLGVMSAFIWLYPALKGGILGQDSEGTLSVMEKLTYSITQSLNPYFRFSSHTDAYYFGLSILLIVLVALLISKGNTKVGMIVVLIIFLGTTKWFLFALKKLPMSQLFWMMRFTPMAMVFFLMALIDWGQLKRKVMYIFLLALTIDCLITLNVVNTSLPIHRASESVAYAVESATQRVSMMDLSTYDADPSYHISYGNESIEMPQVFGWAWQGAATSTNIVELNEAYTKGYYRFMFDRHLELGADTVIVKKTFVSTDNEARLIETANDMGFDLLENFENDYVFKYNVSTEFATKVQYDYIVIGKFAGNLILSFPEFIMGEDDYIDHYSVDELKDYKKIVLTGFKYDNKDNAEMLIQKLLDEGIEVFIDMTGQEGDMYSMRPEFMDVIAQPLNIKGSYPVIDFNNEAYILNNFIDVNYNFNTHYLTNLSEELGTVTVDDQEVTFYGKKDENLYFIGLNFFYHLYSERDIQGLELVGQLIGMEPEKTPSRDIVKVTTRITGNRIEINAEPGTLMPMAMLDSFDSKQSIDEMNNLSLLVEGNTNIEVIYPHVKMGGLISLTGLVIFIVCLFIKEHLEALILKLISTFKEVVIEAKHEKFA